MLQSVLRQRIDPELLRRAAELRQHMTPEERIMWQELRGNRLGVHFRRQQPLAPYIVDFYCHHLRLVVEIDGSPHRQQQGYDRLRDSYLVRLGIRVLRLPNDAIRDDLPAVIRSIRAACSATPTPNPFPTGRGNTKSSAASYPPHPLSEPERANRNRRSSHR